MKNRKKENIKLKKIATKEKPFKIYKPIHHFDIFDKNFERLRNQKISLLEIGVGEGGSLYLWQKYFHNGKIIGLDKKQKKIQSKKLNIKIYQGDQADKKLLKQIIKEEGPFDIVIDDGGHMMDKQIKTFSILFPLLKNNGIYVIEDTSTSYWPEFNGKPEGENTCISFLKCLIDKLNSCAYYHKRAGIYKKIKNNIDYYEEYINSLHFYQNMCFIYKKKKDKLRVFHG